MEWEKEPDICDENEKVRFALGVSGKRMLIVIGLNPSTANKKKSDTTMQKIEKIYKNKNNGYDGFLMLNLCSIREKSPSNLPQNLSESDFKNNLECIKKYLEEYNEADILLAYGNSIIERDYFKESLIDLSSVLQNRCLFVLKKTGEGHPTHPLGKYGSRLENKPLKSFREEFNQDFLSYVETI